MRFLHAADIHLDSPLAGLAARAGERAGELVGATRRAFVGLIDFAIAEQVDFVVIAGDLYDGDWPDYATGLFFAEAMGRLVRAGIRVVIARGNHDAENRMTRKLALPPEIHVFGTRKAETRLWEDLGVAVHGRSFGERQQRENIARDYPPAVAGCFNIGVLHTSLDGRPGHDPYAPCEVADLVARGYDYWALGHIHAREEIRRGEPWVVFSGNLQGRHANETGAKGATLVTVQSQRVVAVEPVELDVVRWLRPVVDVSNCDDWGDVAAAVRTVLAAEQAAAPGRTLAVRLTVTGCGPIHRRLTSHPDHLLAECTAASAHVGGVWIERVVTTTREPPTRNAPGAPGGAVADLLHTFEAVQADRDDFRANLADALKKIPAEISALAGLDTLDDSVLNALLADAQTILLDRLLDHPLDGDEGRS